MSINFSKFDVLGIFNIKDNKGVESLTTKINNEDYLSRNMGYYAEKTYSEHSKKREHLKKLLNNDLSSEKKFIILESMLNSSAKLFYTEFRDNLESPDSKVEISRKCFEEDIYNLINIIESKPINISSFKLPFGDKVAVNRQIELDNKALLYSFVKIFKDVSDYVIITPGLGGIHIGPFFKKMKGSEYTLIAYSAYKDKNINKTTIYDDGFDIKQYALDKELFNKEKKALLLDDNIGTGLTITKMKKLLEKEFENIYLGAIQYNWINYYKVDIGEKDIERFNVSEIDFFTPINYPGHNLIEHAIDIHLKESGQAYVNYLKSKNYRRDDISDFKSLVNRGIYYSNKSGIDLSNSTSNDINKKPNEMASSFFKKISKEIDNIKYNSNEEKDFSL